LPAAESALERTLKTQPSAAAWERLGLVRHLQNKYEQAIPAFRESLRLNPSLWTSHLFLGICLYRTNQFPSALSSLETADRLAPNEHAGRDELDFWLAATRIAMNKTMPGLQVLEKLLQRNPAHVAALELAVRTYADASSGAWNEVAERHFESAPGYEVHGHALESEGNREAALRSFQRSKSLNPKRAGPGLAIGRLLLTSGKAQDALDVLEPELQLAGAAHEAYYYAGLAATQLGRYNDAARWLESAAEWADRNREAPLALAQVYLSLQQLPKAIEAARKAVAAAPASPAAHDILVAALAQAGRDEDLRAEHQRWREQQKK
jgi:tetratricopeptide (TPR) repeat protein